MKEEKRERGRGGWCRRVRGGGEGKMAEVGKKKEMAEGVGEEERKRRDGGKHRWSRR